MTNEGSKVVAGLSVLLFMGIFNSSSIDPNLNRLDWWYKLLSIMLGPNFVGFCTCLWLWIIGRSAFKMIRPAGRDEPNGKPKPRVDDLDA